MKVRIAVAVAAAAAALSGCGDGDGGSAGVAASSSPAAEPKQMRGQILLTSKVGFATNESTTCYGADEYRDLRSGGPVTVYDESSKIIATGVITGGVRPSGVYRCTFTFIVQDLPEANFYQVEVGQYGKVTVQPDEISDVQLSIG